MKCCTKVLIFKTFTKKSENFAKNEFELTYLSMVAVESRSVEVFMGIDDENEMRTFYENDEMTAINYQTHRLEHSAVLEPTTAKYLLDFIYFTRDDEQFRFYKKVSIVKKSSDILCHVVSCPHNERVVINALFIRKNF